MVRAATSVGAYASYATWSSLVRICVRPGCSTWLWFQLKTKTDLAQNKIKRSTKNEISKRVCRLHTCTHGHRNSYVAPLRLYFVVAMQYVMDMTPDLRTQVDYVFALRESIISNKHKLWKYFFGMFEKFEEKGEKGKETEKEEMEKTPVQYYFPRV